jgi:hypothetical protein
VCFGGDELIGRITGGIPVMDMMRVKTMLVGSIQKSAVAESGRDIPHLILAETDVA